MPANHASSSLRNPAFGDANRQASPRFQAKYVLAACVRSVPVRSGVPDRSSSTFSYPVSFYPRIICVLVKRQKVLHNSIMSVPVHNKAMHLNVLPPDDQFSLIDHYLT